MRKNYLTCATLISAMSMSTIASAPVFASDNSDAQTFKIGICNYVDDASLNQIVSNIEKQLEKIEKDSTMAVNAMVELRKEYGVTFNDSDIESAYNKYINYLINQSRNTTK